MGFEQYREPPEELSHNTRTFARMKDWRTEPKEILVTTADVVERGEAGETKVD
jgi:hypothetical protein